VRSLAPAVAVDVLVLCVLYLPALAILSRAMAWTRGSGTPIVVAAFAWMIAFGIVGYQTGNFRCPHCGELFFRKFDDRIWRRTSVQKPFACVACTAACRNGPATTRARTRSPDID
jgi:aldehyde:ferredoxin oxidoreductase